MSGDNTSDGGSQETKTEGAVKASVDNPFFDFADIEGIDAGTGYSTAHGGVIEGERMQVGRVRMPAGTGANLHTHPNEQFIYVEEGTLEARIVGPDGEEYTNSAEPGTVVYIPPNAEHAAHATTDGDVWFYVCKDLSHGIIGDPVDTSGPDAYYEEGYEPDEE
ncbi:MAG: cupin domain-containing protein [Halobacteriota archaeon]